MKINPSKTGTGTLREEILTLVSEYAQSSFENEKQFIPGETPVPVSGKMIGKEEIQYSIDACLDGWFTIGRFAERFEKEFSNFMEQRFCMLTNSGSSANLLAISALTSPQLKERQLKKGDEVITVAAGFPTTVNPIIQNGLIPVFVDVNLDDYGIDIEAMEKAWSPRVKAIMLAHTLGNPFNIKKVKEFVNKHNLWFIEDCCDAVGSKYNGHMVGTFGDIATVSFYPAHHITMGEGGAVLTKNAKLKKIIESFRDWGRDCWCDPGKDNTCGKRFEWQYNELPYGFDHKYIYSHIGYNLKITDMQAAIGFAQLKKLNKFVEMRNTNYKFLYENLQSLSQFLYFLKPSEHSIPSWFGFPIMVKSDCPLNRNQIIKYLDAKKIGTRLLFGGNIIKQPAFKEVNYRQVGELDNTNKIMRDVFWIGVQPSLTENMKKFMVNELSKILMDGGNSV